MYSSVLSGVLYGLKAEIVRVEVDVGNGIPSFEMSGFLSNEVKEARERVRVAIRNSGYELPPQRIVVNISPADIRKCGTGFDLPIALAILSANGYIDEVNVDNMIILGELSLDGSINGVSGVLPCVCEAKKSGISKALIPVSNYNEGRIVEKVNIIPTNSLKMAVQYINNGIIENQRQDNPEQCRTTDKQEINYADICGQEAAKRATMIAVAGMHNIMYIGPPGSGKSMLAKRLSTIMPAMTFKESIETTNIHSVCGLVSKENPLVTKRPFRSPHHTISGAGLSGGGTIPRPGEISLAHNGILFLDELPEFSRQALEILRQPLEDKQVTISRASGTVTYPCSFMLVAAMNPCPCGYFGHPTRKCICGKKQAHAYINRISGPLLDRFDIQVEVAPVEYEHLSSGAKEESSEAIRKRVQAAREIQQKRFAGTDITCNAMITPDILHDVCPMTDEASVMLKNVFEKMGLSARAYDRILKVARTVADMEGEEVIGKSHIARAVQFRSLDRKYWSE